MATDPFAKYRQQQAAKRAGRTTMDSAGDTLKSGAKTDSRGDRVNRKAGTDSRGDTFPKAGAKTKCPNCGAMVTKTKAGACPKCGARM